MKPLPGKGVAPALAESWTVSLDGLVYEFALRKGARFHNDEPVTAEDAKFSWDRYRGIHAKTLKERVAAVETPDAGRVRFRLKQPWPDFLTYFGTVTTSAAWIVPKKYVEKVGDEGFKKAPVGDAKSPWHDRRVRLAANHAIDRPAIDAARTGGLSRITYSIVAGTSDFFWAPPAYAFDPARAKRLLAEAGYPSGFDAGDYSCDLTSADAAEVVIGFLQAVGIRARLRPLERAAFNKSLADRKLHNLVQIIAGAAGNAATRLEAYLASDGLFASGGSADLDGLLREQGTERDRAKREAILQRIQQLVHERALFAPLYDLAFVNGVGARVEESGLGLIAGYAFSAPYEDVKLKAR